MTYKQKIRALKKHMTRPEIAKACGVHISTVDSLASGRRGKAITLRTAQAIDELIDKCTA